MSSYEDWLGTALKNCSLKEIPYKEFSHKKRIKKGGFGIVFKVKCKSLGEVAIKEVDYTDENESRNTFINELKQHSRAKHPRIIQFFGVAIDRDEEINYLVLEYANSGNLRQYLQKFKPKWPEKIRHTIQVAEGMCYLHSINIIHCDLVKRLLFYYQLYVCCKKKTCKCKLKILLYLNKSENYDRSRK
ncbi:kinase-like protein [Gigaspora margarita]|uniref:Kinase-like protein n=1 Tax=Gigaspora margarita TaxID=4874 RepID=A0A8H4A2X1_GIGMA|nr:kinase-like protein [Gigaspora margarita]